MFRGIRGIRGPVPRTAYTADRVYRVPRNRGTTLSGHHQSMYAMWCIGPGWPL